MHKLFDKTKLIAAALCLMGICQACKKEVVNYTPESVEYTQLIDMRDIFNLSEGNYWSFDHYIQIGTQGAMQFKDTCIYKVVNDKNTYKWLAYSNISKFEDGNGTASEKFKFAYTGGYYGVGYIDDRFILYQALNLFADYRPRKLGITLRSGINSAITYQQYDGWEGIEVLGKPERCITWGRDSVAFGSSMDAHKIVEEKFSFTDSIGLVQIKKTVYSKTLLTKGDTVYHTYKLRKFYMKFP
jgi:hypothetical protein